MDCHHGREHLPGQLLVPVGEWPLDLLVLGERVRRRYNADRMPALLKEETVANLSRTPLAGGFLITSVVVVSVVVAVAVVVHLWRRYWRR